LSNKNKSATVLKSKNFFDLNKAYIVCYREFDEQKVRAIFMVKF